MPEKTLKDMPPAHAQGFAEERKMYMPYPGADVADRKDAFVKATMAVIATADHVLGAAQMAIAESRQQTTASSPG